ncbi:protein kinase [Streptomyces sp. NPDC048659]|uniref:protein kinase domain-containing protein n=1 Tax=Streptomyces sp. NPDC048659 TaxID=3155489 RepID=UPI003449DF29
MKPLEPYDPESVGAGAYRLVGRLGQGGMGVVYLGRSRSGRAVAVKVVRPELGTDPEFLRRFAREVAAARRVGGFHTAPVVDADPHGDPPWLVTAYVPGPTLRAVLDRVGALPEDTLTVLAAGLAEALEAVHRAGVVHRDLKPANIIVAEDGPRVIDFGIARALDGTSALTRTGFQVGTPGYLAPEQLTDGAVTPAVDMFALGIVLAQAAGGSPYGDGPSAGRLYRMVHEEPDLSAVPASLRASVAACLAKDPALRPTPTAFLRSLTVHHRPDGGWLPDPATRLLRGPEHTVAPAGAGDAPHGASEDAGACAGDDASDHTGPAGNATRDRAGAPDASGGSGRPATLLVAAAATEPVPVPVPSPLGPPPPVPPPGRGAPPRPGRRRAAPGAVAVVTAVTAVCAVAAALLVWRPWQGAPGAGGDPKPGASTSTGATAAPFPTAPLLVREDTAPGWPGSCHGVIAVRDAATDRPRRLLPGGECDILPQWAPDRASFAFTRVTPGGSAVWTAKADGSGARRIAAIAGGRVSWSPDGTRLAVLREAGGVRQLFAVDVADGSARQLTSGTRQVEDPAWSPDGSRIAVSLEVSPGDWQIHLVDPADPGRAPRRVTRLPHPAMDAAWSPDGRTFAYTAGTYKGATKGDIRLVGTDGSGDRPLVVTGAHDMDPAWSADGRWVAFVRGPYEEPAVWAVRADGTGERRLTTGSAPEGHPAWR